jgi:hypothetical protein
MPGARRLGLIAVGMCLAAVLLLPHLASGRHVGASGTVYVSPGGNDQSCTRGDAARPCKSFGRGYEVARPGDTVSIAGGTYSGTQNIDFDPDKGHAPAVKLTVARGAHVVVDGGLDFNGTSYVTVDGGGRMRVREFNGIMVNGHRPAHLTIENLRAFVLNNRIYPQAGAGSNYFLSPDHLTLRNIEIGPTCCHLDGLVIGAGNHGEPNPTHIVLDRLYIHDVELSCRDLPARYRSGCHEPDTDEHIDCVQFLGGADVVIENSRFFGCSTSDIMTGSGNDGTFSSWTIQNNLFGPLAHPNNGVDITDGGPANSPWSGTIRILHNSFAGPALILAEGAGAFQPGTTAYIAGNVGGLSRLCLPKTVNVTVTFEENMWGGFKCGSTDLPGNVRYVRPTFDAPDLHLQAGSPGIRAVSPTIEPRTDASGALRPLRWKTDVGALQAEPAQIALGRSIGRIALGASIASVQQALGKGAASVRSGVTLTTYHRFGGRLLVRSVSGVVVGVGTTTRYYVTASGLGVGAPATAVKGWTSCGRGFRRAFGGNVVVVTTAGGHIASLWNVRPRYAADACKVG